MPQPVNYYEMIGFQSANPCPTHNLPDAPDLARAALFLDFDGTLTEIAPRPDAIAVAPELPRLLEALDRATGGATAVVSGRQLSDLETFLPDFRGTLIGSHGAERRVNGQRETAAEGQCEPMQGFRDVVEAWTRHKKDVLLEEKPCALVLHFRQAPAAMAEGERFLNSLVEGLEDWTVNHAKLALELMPSRISKGRAVRDLLAEMPDRTPIAIGDDITDETMLAVAVQQGGIGIKVGDGDTHATHVVPSVRAVHEMLESWLAKDAGTPCRIG